MTITRGSIDLKATKAAHDDVKNDILDVGEQISRIMYVAYANSISGEGFTVDDLYSVVNEPNDEDIETYFEFYLDPYTGEYSFYPTEDEEVVDGKTYYIESSNTHAFRGMCFSSSNIQPTEPNYYTWEINPEWASKYADSYLHEIDGGVAIFNSDLNDTTYAAITALALSFYLNGNQQLRVGYEESINDYGVISETHIALGSGAGVKFDNYGHSAEGSRGRYVWEVRDNGHLSLKLY